MSLICFCVVVFFCMQKPAYEMRISDWSSDVGSSDLPASPMDPRDERMVARFKFREVRARPGDARRGEMVLRWRQHMSAPVRASRSLHRCHPHPSPPPSKGEGKILQLPGNPLPPLGGGLGGGVAERPMPA